MDVHILQELILLPDKFHRLIRSNPSPPANRLFRTAVGCVCINYSPFVDRTLTGCGWDRLCPNHPPMWVCKYRYFEEGGRERFSDYLICITAAAAVLSFKIQMLGFRGSRNCDWPAPSHHFTPDTLLYMMRRVSTYMGEVSQHSCGAWA